ncbi:Fras1 related extracellular matrix protein [Elysia marginata]|uniref:Fras1 related extracellular matrix protein n=1 Tax=Elysia marginata TaxID=1093978 RepID=A0AAV4J0S9_9GAST|nr:Fras1 related extracellular matrix protein [Elysia marginata]
MKRDRWDEINEIFSNVTAQNCRSKDKADLMLPLDSVSAVPKANEILSSKTYSNRSALLHVHNMALNRAFFYSLIYQRLNQSWDFETQPGLMYIYMSMSADISASPGYINGSGIFFDNDCYYPNWYTTLPFNKTIPLFGPKAWREDDYNEPTNYLREPTNNTMDIWDLAAGNSRNYTDKRYKGNPWVQFWLPDIKADKDSARKHTYSVGIMYSNVTGSFTEETFKEFNFFGPQLPGSESPDEMLPVRITQPYFDCGQSNRWIVTASAPVVEYMPRYSDFILMRRPRFTAVYTVDIEFERLDMNQCPIMQGNPGPNAFAGTARCRPTTSCEPLMGYGFRRGGYQCVCNPGYYYPWWHDGPFMGLEIEEASREEYEVGFDCLTIQDRQVLPQIKNPEFVRKKRSMARTKDRFLAEVEGERQSPRLTNRMKRELIPKIKEIRESVMREKREAEAAHPKVTIKKRHTAKVKVDKSKAHSRRKREATDENAVNRMKTILDRYRSINRLNCKQQPAHKLFLPGDAAYGAEKQFEPQGRTALRLAHFLSNFLQNVDEYEEFGNLRGDRRLNETQIFAEVISNVMADFKIVGAGVFFDRYKFRMSPPVNNTDPRFVNGITREFFGPYAWREPDPTGSVRATSNFNAMDLAGLQTYYTDEPWFQDMKARWATNFVHLKKFTAKPMIRSDIPGTSLIRFEYYPYTYRAPQYEDGEWLRPQFKCNGRYDAWVVPYQVPFFGWDDIKARLEFKGVVTVEVALSELGMNQCPQDYHVPNAFKNTARCHFQSQYCTPMEAWEFREGFYKCECRQGFEYTFVDNNWYFDGQTMEDEYKKMMAGQPNRFETLRCRISGAASTPVSMTVMALATVITFLVQTSLKKF